MSWTLYPASDFPDHQNLWRQLHQEAGASPLLDPSFISSLLDVFGTGKEILACYKSLNNVKAMCIIAPGRMGSWNTFQPSQAPLGAWMHEPGLEWDELLDTLIKTLPGFPLALGITQQDPDLVVRPGNSKSMYSLDYIPTARISLRGTFDDYWAVRGKNLRQNMRKQRNKLDSESIVTRLQLSTKPEEVAEAIADYGRIESAGWKGKNGTNVHPANAQGKFYQILLEQFCQRGVGRIYRYWYNESVVAMDLCIEGNNSIIILKTAYDESIENATSPALLMRQEIFKQLFDDRGLERIEFYGRVMEWHTKWTHEFRTLYHVNYHRFPVLRSLRNFGQKI